MKADLPDVQASHNKLLRSERLGKTEMVGNATCILSAAAIGPTATGWSKETETVNVFVHWASVLRRSLRHHERHVLVQQLRYH